MIFLPYGFTLLRDCSLNFEIKNLHHTSDSFLCKPSVLANPAYKTPKHFSDCSANISNQYALSFRLFYSIYSVLLLHLCTFYASKRVYNDFKLQSHNSLEDFSWINTSTNSSWITEWWKRHLGWVVSTISLGISLVLYLQSYDIRERDLSPGRAP